MSSDTSKGMGKSLPMSVHNLGFLLDRLGQDCAPLQFLRELTQNAIEALARTDQPGEIVWDVDWILYDLGDSRVMKLSVTDTGDGMTGEEMRQFINQLSSSGSNQSFSANYGVGAKIAAATKNPAGVIYQSWKNGEGAMIQLQKDTATGQYGLKQWELSDGSYSYHLPLDAAGKPESIQTHGTKVVLLGISEDHNTMNPPAEAAAPSRWISKYLNTRYFQLPPGITLRAREGWDSPRHDTDRNVLRSLTGQKPYLDNHSMDRGVQELDSVRIHWWILRDEPALTNNSGYIESAGHVAALYQNELYDRATSRSGTSILQQFGILFGQRQVVIYAEPTNSEQLTTNTARTTLLMNGDKLPWADWALEFRNSMPKVLLDFVQSKASAATEHDHLKSIKERLKAVMDLYKVSRYRPVPQGVYLSDPTSLIKVAADPVKRAKSSDSKSGSGGGTSTAVRDTDLGDIYHLFEKKGGVNSDKVRADPFPQVTWVSVKDDTRDATDMDDRAAKYIEGQNHLLINADFRVFGDMIGKLARSRDATGNLDVGTVVVDVVHGWFEQALVETVIGILQLRGSKEWGPAEIEKALSEEALTSCVMQRYHVFNACKRDLGSKLGRGLIPEVV